MAKKKTNVPENETKKAKFKRVVEPRVGKAIKMIGLIENCTGGEYEYAPKDVSNIITGLLRAVNQLDSAFKNKGAKSTGFSLD